MLLNRVSVNDDLNLKGSCTRRLQGDYLKYTFSYKDPMNLCLSLLKFPNVAGYRIRTKTPAKIPTKITGYRLKSTDK